MVEFLVGALSYIGPFLLVLGLVVTIHEFGHFLAARGLGMAVDRFAIGFGRPIAAWKDRAGVEWRIGWAPLGGYVRFAGDENIASVPDQADLAAMRSEIEKREGVAAVARYFHFRPIWQRAIVVAAGPFANFGLAIVLSGPGCGGDQKPPTKAPKVADPDGDVKPQPGGAKAG